MKRALSLLAIAVLLAAADPPEYTEAMKLVAAQDFAAAQRQIRILVQRYPGNPKVLNLQGLAYIGEGKSADAIGAFEAALKSAPGFSPALKNLTIHEWTIGRQPSGRRHLEAALKLEPGDPLLNALAAIPALERKDYATAKRHLDLGAGRITALPPQTEFQIGLLLASNERHAEAAARFESLLSRIGDSDEVRYNLALCLFQAGQKARAASVLEAVKKRRRSSEVYNLLARIYAGSGRGQDAVDALREAIALDPQDETNYLDLAITCIDHNIYPQGLAVVEAGLTVKPGSQRLMLQRGILRSLMGQFDEAEADFEQAGRKDPGNPLSSAGLGLAAIQRSELPSAIRLLRERRARQNDAVLSYLLGWALVRSGSAPGSAEFKEAEAAFESAIRLNPKLPYPYAELGKVYVKTDRPTKAIPILERALALAPNERSAYAQLAAAYRKTGQPDRAKKVMEALVKLNEQDRSRAAAAITSFKPGAAASQ